MRILVLVTLISPTGEYGGPVRVALNQAAALAARGHDVLVAGGQRGWGAAPPMVVEGVRTTLFPVRTLLPGAGFAGLAAPGLLRALPALTREVDQVHVHVARDLVTLPAVAWLRRHGIPYVLQTHGMIDPSANPLSIPLDALVTRRALRGARRVFYLTPRERKDLERVAGPQLHLEELPNGVPVSPLAAGHARNEVLYLARLAVRKRPLIFVEMARRLLDRFPTTEFRLVGPDGGEGPAVRSALVAADDERISWEGPLEPALTIGRMRRAAVYVLPSVDEPYPMSVLEAMASGLPVVITETCGLAGLVRACGGGLVVDESLDALTEAVASLLADPEASLRMGTAGRDHVQRHLSMTAIAEQLEAAYRAA